MDTARRAQISDTIPGSQRPAIDSDVAKTPKGFWTPKTAFALCTALVLLACLFLLSRYNFLLFHGFAEIFSIVVAWSVFILVWNSRHMMSNDALLFLGISFLFVGLIDLVHTFAYKGMGIISSDRGANPATQLWISARYMEGVSLLIFPLFLTRTLRYYRTIALYAGVTAILFGAIFYWGIFPVCYVEGTGLTPFKKISEYVICLILAGALGVLYHHRHAFGMRLFRLMAASIGLTICGELAFTFYISVYGISNVIGHYFKILSFFCIYAALIRSSLKDPYTSLFRDLKERESRLAHSETNLKEAQKIARLGSWTWDLQTNHIQWSEEMYRIYDMTPGSPVSNEAVRGRVLAEDLPLFDDAFERFLRGDVPESIEYRIQKADGEIRWIHSKAKETRDPSGNLMKLSGTAQDLTDQRVMAEKLRSSEEKYRNLFDVSPIGIELYDADGRLIEANDACLHIFGVLDGSEIKGFNLFEDPNVTEEIKKSLKGGIPSRYEVPFSFDLVRKERLYATSREGIMHLDVLITPLKSPSGDRVDGYMVQVQDITQRIVAAEEGRLSGMRLEIIYQIAAMIDADETRIADFVLERMLDLSGSPIGFLGYISDDQETMMIHSWSGSVMDACRIQDKPMEFPISDAGIWGEPVRNKEPIVINDYGVPHPAKRGTPGGHVAMHRFMSVPVLDKGKVVLIAAVGNKADPYTRTDVLQLERLMQGAWEQILRKRQEFKIAEKEGLWRSLAQSSPDHILLIDRDLKITFANHASPGLSVEDLIGKDILSYVEEDRQSEIRSLLEHALTHGERVTYETVYPTPEGENVFYESIVIPRKIGNDIVGLTLSARDITEQKRAEREKELLQEQLRQARKMEAIGTLAGGIAHDFNNILSPILVYTEMALMDLPGDSPLRMGLQQINIAGERARDLVEQILAFARKQKGELVKTKASLIVKEAVKFMRSTIPTTIGIQYDMPASRDLILADPTQLNQILMNLCTNAAHSMEERGGMLNVILENEYFDSRSAQRISDLEPGHYLKLTVADTGHGIAPESLDKIFEPYFTTKEVGKGTGMGLALVHGIVKSHGGAISAESEVGKGSSFHVYFPLVEPDAPVSDTSADTTQRPSGNERILLVDDERLVVDASKMMLEKLGYKVTARTSSIEALELFRHNPGDFDMLITDQTMPDMTGKELAGEMQSIRPDMPIILCTGFSEQMDEKKAKEMGIRGFIMKPVGMKKMAQKVREVLDAQ